MILIAKKLIKKWAFWLAAASAAVIIFHVIAASHFFVEGQQWPDDVLYFSNPVSAFAVFLITGLIPGRVFLGAENFLPVMGLYYKFTSYLPYYVAHFLFYIFFGVIIDFLIQRNRKNANLNKNNLANACKFY